MRPPNALYHKFHIRCSGVTLASTWTTSGALVLHLLTLGGYSSTWCHPNVSQCNTRAPGVIQVLASVTPEQQMSSKC